MKTKLLLVVALVGLLLTTAGFQVFSPVGEAEDPNVTITFPPPIYLLRGTVEVRGTANASGLIGHYLEYRPLTEAFETEEGTTGWSPATLPVNSAVIDDVLATWDTTEIEDGAYEIRLAVITNTGTTYARVSPIRIENELPPFLTLEAPITPPPGVQVQPTAVQVQPTAVPTTPQASARNQSVNVRTGDSTVYPTVGSLNVGDTATILGVSNRGTGWYQIQLPNGRVGFVSPSVVNVTGDVSNLPRVSPPPPPAPTVTPLPTATPVPTLPDATITLVRFDRAIQQGQPFQFIVTVLNPTSVALPGVAIACNFTPQNQFFSGTLNALGPNSQIDVAVTAQLDSGGGANTTANCAVDVNNLVAELNEGNNFFNLTTLLAAP